MAHLLYGVQQHGLEEVRGCVCHGAGVSRALGAPCGPQQPRGTRYGPQQRLQGRQGACGGRPRLQARGGA